MYGYVRVVGFIKGFRILSYVVVYIVYSELLISLVMSSLCIWVGTPLKYFV